MLFKWQVIPLWIYRRYRLLSDTPHMFSTNEILILWEIHRHITILEAGVLSALIHVFVSINSEGNRNFRQTTHNLTKNRALESSWSSLPLAMTIWLVNLILLVIFIWSHRINCSYCGDPRIPMVLVNSFRRCMPRPIHSSRWCHRSRDRQCCHMRFKFLYLFVGNSGWRDPFVHTSGHWCQDWCNPWKSSICYNIPYDPRTPIRSMLGALWCNAWIYANLICMSVSIECWRESPEEDVTRVSFRPYRTWFFFNLYKHLLAQRSQSLTVDANTEFQYQSPGFKGSHTLATSAFQYKRCIICKLCEQTCPASAISILAIPHNLFSKQRTISIQYWLPEVYILWNLCRGMSHFIHTGTTGLWVLPNLELQHKDMAAIKHLAANLNPSVRYVRILFAVLFLPPFFYLIHTSNGFGFYGTLMQTSVLSAGFKTPTDTTVFWGGLLFS